MKTLTLFFEKYLVVYDCVTATVEKRFT